MRTIKARNGFEFKFPFEPPWEDLRAEGATPNGGRFYIFDSCVIRDPEERAAMGRRAGELFQSQFTGEVFAKQIERVYLDVLKGDAHGTT